MSHLTGKTVVTYAISDDQVARDIVGVMRL